MYNELDALFITAKEAADALMWRNYTDPTAARNMLDRVDVQKELCRCWIGEDMFSNVMEAADLAGYEVAFDRRPSGIYGIEYFEKRGGTNGQPK